MLQRLFEIGWNYLTDTYSCQFLRVWGTLLVHLIFTLVCSSVLFILHKTEIIPLKFKIQKEKKLASFNDQFNAMLYVLATQAFIQLPPNLLVIYYNIGDFGTDMKCSYSDMPPWYNILFICYICLIIEDTWHYFAHRALHHKSIYGLIHKLHHEYTSPFSHTAEYAHPLETVILGIGFFIGLYLFCMDHVILMWSWLLFRLCETYEAHSGYDIPLKYGNLLKLMPGYGGAYMHDFHHKNFKGNYASTFIWWDIICGTNKQWQMEEYRKRNKLCKQISSEMMDEFNEKDYEFVGVVDEKKIPKVCLVTGGAGMVGSRLCQMLIQRGAEKIISVDIQPPNEEQQKRNDDKKIEYVTADICDVEKLEVAFNGKDKIDAVFHIAALVGPFYKHELYYKVNYLGTQNIINLCQKYKISVLVDCSSPSTRMSTFDINGMSEKDFEIRGGGNPYPKHSLHEYGRTKALAEKLVLKSNGDQGLYTAVIAPHQVYGPQDQLFMPNFINTAIDGKLFKFGDGQSIVSLTHVDNVCWGLILAAINLLDEKRRQIVGGQFYFVTDDGCYNIWDKIDDAVQQYDANITSLKQRVHLNKYFLYTLGYLGSIYTKITGKFVKLTPFTVRMLTMNRYFNITKIKKELGYKPLIKHDEGWNDVVKAVTDRIRKQRTKQ